MLTDIVTHYKRIFSLPHLPFLRLSTLRVHTHTETPYLEEDNDGADEHAEALEKIAHHVDKGRSHTGIGLLSPPS